MGINGRFRGVRSTTTAGEGGREGGRAGRQMRRERDRRRLKERRRKRSHTNPFGRELRVNYSSFVFYLDTSVWEQGSSKARQPLIDAVGPGGFTHSADGARGAGGRGANGARNWGRPANGYFGWHRNCKNRDAGGAMWRARHFWFGFIGASAVLWFGRDFPHGG